MDPPSAAGADRSPELDGRAVVGAVFSLRHQAELEIRRMIGGHDPVFVYGTADEIKGFVHRRLLFLKRWRFLLPLAWSGSRQRQTRS
jgi:hypothetical protein